MTPENERTIRHQRIVEIASFQSLVGDRKSGCVPLIAGNVQIDL